MMKSSLFCVVFLSVFLVTRGFQPIEPPKPVEKLKSTDDGSQVSIPDMNDDILLPGTSTNSQTRGIAYNVVNKWPSGVIPYDISAITNAQDRQLIELAMQTVMYDTGSPISGSTSRNPCVYFRPRQSTDKTFLTIVHGTGCNAHLGYWANFGLKMTLQKDSSASCFYIGTIQHELLHALGFDHEHSRPDRDNFVQINYGNIDTQWHYAFERRVWGSTAVNLSTPYDYDSIMHYGNDYFSKNGLPTIVPRQANVRIGNREKLSPTDILEVRRFYGCQA